MTTDKEKECKSFVLETSNNPNVGTIKLFCPFYEEIVRMKNDIEWLKKAYNVQILIGAGTFITTLIAILKLTGVV